jgi:hypothetical protein
MKLPKNYYSSQLNGLGFNNTSDFNSATGHSSVKLCLANNMGSTNYINIDVKCLRDINKALQAMEKRIR